MDRNIQVNQLLLLDFLRSAALFLTSGLRPLAHACKQINRDTQDSNSSDEENLSKAQFEEPEVHKSRGTVLITLRNVKPYTEW